ncbi:hypothetical protein [Shimia sp.]|uniref:hypothetical protein n=1 Tax=Shimia sp. TaxID=1954381 RepID=UPI003BAD1EA6
MTANLGLVNWGGGDLPRAIPDGGRGGNTSDHSMSDKDLAGLQEKSAKEAIESLSGDFAEGNLPIDDVVTFPGPISEAYYWSEADVVGICGPVGSGKTTTKNKRKLRRAIMMPTSTKDRVALVDGEWIEIKPADEADWIARGYQTSGWRRYKVIYTRQTYRELWSTTIPSYLETFPKDMGSWSGGRGDPVKHVIYFEDPHGPIEFTAEFMAFGDDPIAAMRGLQTTDLDLNEADTMVVEILTVGIGRIDRFPAREHFEGLPADLRSYGCIDCDFNAPDEDNWTHGVFYDEEKRKETAKMLSAELPEGSKPIEVAFFNQPGFGEEGCENLQNLGPTYYQRQIAAMTLAGRGDMVDRLVFNKIVYLKQGDPVFKREYNRRIHVSAEPLKALPGVPLRLGLDQGFKAAAVVAQCGADYRWRILGELHFPEERLLGAVFGARLVDYIEENWPGFRVEAGWADMAGEQGQSGAEEENASWNRALKRATGYTIRPQKLGNNRVNTRLAATRAALEAPLVAGAPGILIDPRCKFLIRGFEARYVWAEEVNKNGDKFKTPNKQLTEANVHDALQYLLLSEHSGDGASPYERKKSPDTHPAQMGHNGGPSMSGGSNGLQTDWDVTNPYGG